ncbi:MAG: fibronectin type III domain-containing protein [Blastocatellia bacterium]
MADSKKRGLSLEWYVISKRSIYLLVAAVAGLIAVTGGAYWLYHTTRDSLSNLDQIGRKSARFIQIEGRVRLKRANETEFHEAKDDMTLEAGDTIQTLADSVARVQFVDGSSYTIRPDTTLVIKDNSLNADRSTRVQVAVGVGRINLATGEQAAGSSNVVQTSTASASIGSQTEASVAADGRSEKTEIRIARGSAKINTQSGQSYDARPNERIEIAASGQVVREKMLPVPTLNSPENQRTLKVAAGRPAQVSFAWSGIPQARNYRIEVATSAYFGDTVVATRDQLGSTNAVFDNLQPGSYYWRVRANSEKEGAGQFSEPFKFSLVTNAAGQTLQISVTRQTPLGGDVYKIEGRSEPGARVRVGETLARVSADGSFTALVTVTNGRREVLIEAEDQDGNTGQKRVRL